MKLEKKKNCHPIILVASVSKCFPLAVWMYNFIKYDEAEVQFSIPFHLARVFVLLLT